MQIALLIILIIIANLVLYWLFFGKKRFEQKIVREVDHGRTETRH